MFYTLPSLSPCQLGQRRCRERERLQRDHCQRLLLSDLPPTAMPVIPLSSSTSEPMRMPSLSSNSLLSSSVLTSSQAIMPSSRQLPQRGRPDRECMAREGHAVLPAASLPPYPPPRSWYMTASPFVAFTLYSLHDTSDSQLPLHCEHQLLTHYGTPTGAVDAGPCALISSLLDERNSHDCVTDRHRHLKHL